MVMSILHEKETNMTLEEVKNQYGTVVYRLEQLEGNVNAFHDKTTNKLGEIGDTLIRLNTNLEAGKFNTINCPIHSQRLTRLENIQNTQGDEIAKLKNWKYYCVGLAVGIGILIKVVFGIG